MLQLPQQHLQRVDRQMRRVPGSLRQASDFPEQRFPADCSRLVNGFALDQLGDRRSASHRRHAAFGTKSDVGDRAPTQLQAKLQNVSAGWIFQLSRRIWSFHDAGISRMLEMVEQFSRVHSAILNALTSAAPPVLLGCLFQTLSAGLV